MKAVQLGPRQLGLMVVREGTSVKGPDRNES